MKETTPGKNSVGKPVGLSFQTHGIYSEGPSGSLARTYQSLPIQGSLNQQFLYIVFNQWEALLYYLFATCINTKCHMFLSPFQNLQEAMVDALSLVLQGLEVYAFSPYQLIGRLLQQFHMTQQCIMILIAPAAPFVVRNSRGTSGGAAVGASSAKDTSNAATI